MVLQQVATSAYVHEVLYIGSAIPLETSDGLDAVQQPLRHRYPVNSEDNIQGMMARLEVRPEGIQLKFKDDKNQVVLFPYSSLTLCAAVRCIKVVDDKTKQLKPKFVSLTSPEAGGVNSEKPAIFTAITRRTKGRQVLECHGFITMHPKDALDLVRWVNQFDRKAKQEGMTSFSAAATPRGNFETSTAQAGINFGPDGDASGDIYPVQLVPGAPVEPNAGPTFYQEPPENGYFYTTKNAGVKKYSLEKMTRGGRADTIESRSAVGAGSVLNGADESFHPGTDIMDGPPRGYAGSTVSAPAYQMGARHPYMMPMRHFRPPPMYMRQMMYGPPPPMMYGYPRSQLMPMPPEMMRARPVPVMIPGPPPGGYYPPPPRGRGSRGSTPSDRSSSAGTPRAPRSKHKTPKQNGGAATTGDESSDEGSRPRTPPTDYDQPKGPRVSRKEGHMREKRSASPSYSAPLYPANQGYYMMPQYGYYPGHPGMIPRNHSVPPDTERGKEKKSKKKSKKDKKKKNMSKENSNIREYESADSMGYQSELGPNALPFRRFQNQFQHERAFSKSLAEEIKKSDGSLGRNAYNLNATDPTPGMPLF